MKFVIKSKPKEEYQNYLLIKNKYPKLNGVTNSNNNQVTVNNSNDATEDEDKNKYKLENDETSIRLMKMYPLGFSFCSEDDEKTNKKEGFQTPRKMKKKRNDNEEPEKDEKFCVYNIWVPDCTRSKKDFLECQDIDMAQLDTKEKFVAEFRKTKSANEYEEFRVCVRHTSTRILLGVELKFNIEIDVSDSFYSHTGSKLRAYSFQGSNRHDVYSGFNYFRSSWTPFMAINSVTDYDILFQPDNWYYSVIQSAKPDKLNEGEKEEEMEDVEPQKEEKEEEEAVEEYQKPDEEGINVSNRIFKTQSPIRYKEINDIKNPIDTSSEIEIVQNINNKNRYTKKSVSTTFLSLLSLCSAYLKFPTINFNKFLFTSISKENESLSGVNSNAAKINKNNNKNFETLSGTFPNESFTLNVKYKLMDFLVDDLGRPIPIWIRLDGRNCEDKLSDLKSIKKSYKNLSLEHI